VAAKGGGDQVANIVGGHVTLGIAGIGEFAEHVKGGRMRALAVSAPTKTDGIPSLKEQGVDVVLGNWRGVFGGPGITPAQRDALVAAVRTATDSPAWKESLARYGWDPVYLGGDAYKTFVDEDTKRITAILESLGLRK
jgi:putative tricarboxylic transport membrane protein